MTTLGEVVDLLHSWYPPQTADSWDAVGLVHGDPSATVKKVMFAVDPTEQVAKEAVAWGADLLVCHHPLFLKPVHGFAATTAKGRTMAALVKGDCALLTAHTNADQAESGVSEALASALGLQDLTPIVAAPAEPLDKIVVFVPADAAAPVRAAIADAGAGAIGNYDHCTFSTDGQGRFRPLEGAEPTIGNVGDIALVDEQRIEAVMPRHRRAAVVEAMLANHPYETPAHDVFELADAGQVSTGTGRIGTIEETTLRDFAQVVAEVLPETEQGVRVGGDPDRVVRRVAVCGGAGDFLLEQLAGADVDVYLTSDLRHHPAAEFLEKDGPALIDVAHWAAESTWLPVVQSRLAEALGDTVDSRVSEVRTDPWTFRI
ncbi:Nif3-like dinuclear metal center hexameric protein [Nocardioides sp. Soil797]|nr:Nif3-like dinuclear metal center hexameric protein [Nocardioides sp. Soil797]